MFHPECGSSGLIDLHWLVKASYRRRFSRRVWPLKGMRFTENVLNRYVTLERLDMQPVTREKAQLMSASEIDRTLVRLAHEILEKTEDLNQLAFIGIRRRGVPLAQRLADKIKQAREAGNSGRDSRHQSLSRRSLHHL